MQHLINTVTITIQSAE